jgi:2-polyprenyl-3-methyl-5-hydroxy-6-metoxy-1,4-benzoquinol methylase
MLKSLAHWVGRSYVRAINQSEVEAQQFKRHNERPIEFAFAFEKLGQLRPTTVLDVGTGTTALPSLIASCGCVVTAMDNVSDYWPSGMVNRHWHVIDGDIKNPKFSRQYDLVTCISVVEHIEDHVAAFRGMVSLTKPGGHIVVTTPYNETRAIPNVYKLPDCAYKDDVPYICRSSDRQNVDRWVACGAEIVEQQYWRLWSGEVWAQGRFLDAAELVASSEPHQLTCLLFKRSA